MRFKVVNIHCALSIVVWKTEHNVDCVVNGVVLLSITVIMKEDISQMSRKE
jgi:hypothetical protein